MPQKKTENKANCWEYMKCGREPGGNNTQALGICPAAIYSPADDFLDGKNGGRACMYISCTFCGNEVQGTHIDKQEKCSQCSFYQKLEKDHGKDAVIENYNKHIREYFENLTDETPVSSTKIDSLLLKMAESYFPFKKISKRRFQQMVDFFKIIEMEESEVIQLKRRKAETFLYVAQGNIDLIQSSSIRSFSTFDLMGKPLMLKKEMGRVSLVCTEPAIIVLVDKRMVEQIVSWDSAFKVARHEIESGVINKSLLLRRLPEKTINEIKTKLARIEVKKGDVIVEIGKDNDKYFIIDSGKAEAFIKNPANSQVEKITDLVPGDSFGAQSTVSGYPSSRRITMSEDGALLALGKEDLVELIKEPLINLVHADEAKKMIDEGYKPLDTRLNEEYEAEHITGAINIPISELEERLPELDINTKYLIYSNTGNLSVTACVMLMRRNYQVASLQKGIRGWPFEKSGGLEAFKTTASVFGAKAPKAASRKRDDIILRERAE